MKYKICGIIIALIAHIILYFYMVQPILTINNDIEGMGRLVLSVVPYFPVSMLAFLIAMIFHSSGAYINTILVTDRHR